MAFEQVMGQVQQWAGAAQGLAGLGARLAAMEAGSSVPPDVLAALDEVVAAAGLSDLDELPPPQRGAALALSRAFLHQAVDLIDDPGRAPGWGFTDPAILDGWGRASMMMPMAIAGAHPDLAAVTRFLDVGTGVGLLAISATDVWPEATVVGIDGSPVSLARAKEHVDGAGRGDRIELRDQWVTDLPDVDAFDCAWLPSFFLSDAALEAGVPAIVRALRPGGWVVFACPAPPPNPFKAALDRLEAVRNDGSQCTPDQATALLERAGCADVHVAAALPIPITFVLGRRA
jgi:SAM-dependent methyltransferase